MRYLLDALLRLFMSTKDRRGAQSTELRLRLQVEFAYYPTDKLVRENGARRPINGCHRSSVILSPGLLWSFRRWFVPLEPVGDAVHMDVHANAHISVPNHHQHGYDHRRIQNMRELTYPKRHANTKMPSLAPHRGASKVRRQSSGHPNQSRPAGAVRPGLCT